MSNFIEIGIHLVEKQQICGLTRGEELTLVIHLKSGASLCVTYGSGRESCADWKRLNSLLSSEASKYNAGITDEEGTFFNRIYPTLSMRLSELDSFDKHQSIEITNLGRHLVEMQDIVYQYKNKIQKIEQALIQYGLINLLKGEKP